MNAHCDGWVLLVKWSFTGALGKFLQLAEDRAVVCCCCTGEVCWNEFCVFHVLDLGVSVGSCVKEIGNKGSLLEWSSQSPTKCLVLTSQISEVKREMCPLITNQDETV